MEKSASILVITCAAIAREVNEIKKLGCWSQMDLQAITADLHSRPQEIPAAVAEKIDSARDQYEHIFVAYGDCGTGGLLDAMLSEEGVERIGGNHCYEFFAGTVNFSEITRIGHSSYNGSLRMHVTAAYYPNILIFVTIPGLVSSLIAIKISVIL